MPTASDRERAIAYLDSSALVKLVIDEPESRALRDALRAWPRRASSRLAVVEVLRAVRAKRPEVEQRAHQVLSHSDLLRITDRILLQAAALTPRTLASLDAIHVATALRLRAQLAAFVSYDTRQLEAAEAVGMPAVVPR